MGNSKENKGKDITEEFKAHIAEFASKHDMSSSELYKTTYKVYEEFYRKCQQETIELHKSEIVGRYFKYYEWGDEQDDDYASYVYVTGIFGNMSEVIVSMAGMYYEHGHTYDDQSSNFFRFSQEIVYPKGASTEEMWDDIKKHFVEITEEEFFAKVRVEAEAICPRMEEWIKSAKKTVEKRHGRED